MIQIAVLGYGTVGSGVVEVIGTNAASIAGKVGEELSVKYVLDLRDFPGDPIQEKVVHDYDIILNDPDVRIVVETMGGVEPAYTFSKKALLAGKSVCTSNKELVANRGTELLAIAAEKHVNYLFEASCGGGIPIIRPLHTCLTAEVVEEITGILNGTTNYILTEMEQKGADFADVLKDAQNKGYAERNPEADVEGYDACRKIAILSSLAFGKEVRYEDIYTEGITKITAADFLYAKALGMRIKLLADGWSEDGKYYAMVAPALVSTEDPLYAVNGVFNGIFVRGNMLGDAMFYGSGAGKLPTASAVVGDVIEEARNLNVTVQPSWAAETLALTDIGTSKKAFLVRAKGDQREELSRAAEIFGPIRPVLLELPGEYGFVTESLTENAFAEAAEKLGTVISRIRVREL